MTSIRSIRLAVWTLMAAGACVMSAQTPAITIKTLDVVKRTDTLDLAIVFDQILALDHPEDLTDSNITILAKPSGARMMPSRIHATTDSTATITLVALPDAKDDSINVCFKTLHFKTLDDDKTNTSAAGKPVCSTSKIMTQAETKALAGQLNAAAAKAKADKSSSEKDIFASGFVTTAGQSKTQGGADISLNSLLNGIPGANSFLQIQKTSVAAGDPRHFEAGLSWRHTSSFDHALDATIANELKQFQNAQTEADQQNLGEKINADSAKYGVMLGALEDLAIKMEGDPTNFKAANTVGDGDVRFLTRTLKLFGSTNGYFRARPLIVGFEGGRSIGQGDMTTPDVDWIARGKVGGDFTLFYDNSQSKGPIKRLEINAGGVERYLFFKEVNYNATTKMDSSTGKGSRPYFQTDVKLFFAQDSKGRYGVRMAYTRGSLPPVFADVKSFQFGFVFETVDDKVK